MCTRDCQTCKFAEWEYCEGYAGGYPRGLWSVCGCLITEDEKRKIEDMARYDDVEIPEEWDNEWGDTKDCPYWREV